MSNSRESENPTIPNYFYVKPKAPEQFRGKFVLGINLNSDGTWEATRASGDGPAAQGVKLNSSIVIADISEEAEREIMSALEKEDSLQKSRNKMIDKKYAMFALQDLEWLW